MEWFDVPNHVPPEAGLYAFKVRVMIAGEFNDIRQFAGLAYWNGKYWDNPGQYRVEQWAYCHFPQKKAKDNVFSVFCKCKLCDGE